MTFQPKIRNKIHKSICKHEKSQVTLVVQQYSVINSYIHNLNFETGRFLINSAHRKSSNQLKWMML